MFLSNEVSRPQSEQRSSICRDRGAGELQQAHNNVDGSDDRQLASHWHILNFRNYTNDLTMRTGNFNIHFGFFRFAVDGLFDADLRAAFSLVFFDVFAIFLCFGLVFLADVFSV